MLALLVDGLCLYNLNKFDGFGLFLNFLDIALGFFDWMILWVRGGGLGDALAFWLLALVYLVKIDGLFLVGNGVVEVHDIEIDEKGIEWFDGLWVFDSVVPGVVVEVG